jgi:hypothetical protein
MANAKIVWTPAGGSPQSYTFPVNFTWDYQEAYQDMADRDRALDGTLRSYHRNLKQHWNLIFKFISTAQKEQFFLIKQAQVDVDFYREAGLGKSMSAAWVNDFNFKEVLPGYWSGSMELEEV